MTRWRIERDHPELKQEFGLSDNQGRGWRGFHHHATLCITAYGFLLSQRLRSGGDKRTVLNKKRHSYPRAAHRAAPQPEECSATFQTPSQRCATCLLASLLDNSIDVRAARGRW